MSVLVSLGELKSYLRYDATDQDTELQAILDAVEALLSDLTDQTFGPGGPVADENHSGDATNVLVLRRPASSVTSVKVSAARTPSTPDETIDASQLAIDPVMTQRLIRYQGGVFPRGVLNLFVTYQAADNLPEIGKQAVKQAAAFIHRRRGSEHVRSQSLGDLGSQVLIEEAQSLWSQPFWRAAVEQLSKPSLVLA